MQPMVVVSFDQAERVIDASDHFSAWVNGAIAPGNTLSSLLVETDYLQLREFLRKAVSEGYAECSFVPSAPGEESYRIYVTAIEESPGHTYFNLTALPSIRNQSLSVSEKEAYHYLRVTLDTIDQGVTIYDENLRLVAWNAVYEQMCICPAEFIRKGTFLGDVYVAIAKMGVFGEGAPEVLAHKHIDAIRTRHMVAEEELYPPTGRVIKIHRYYLPDGGICATFTDITEQKHFEERLIRQTKTDYLTGSHNRAAVLERLGDLTATDNSKPFHFLFLDLDHFKLINDSYGHHIGNQVICQVTERITRLLGKDNGDCVGRLGGDEFGVVLESAASRAEAEAFCQRLVEAISLPCEFGSHTFYVSCTVGVSAYPEHGETAEQVIQKADVAMYSAKLAGRNGYEFYDHEIDEQVLRSDRICETILQDMTEGDENFYLVFQPICGMADGRVTGVEALLRWRRQGDFGLSTDEMISIMESQGIIARTGRQICRQALEVFMKHLDDLPDDIYLSINFSSLQISQIGFAQELITMVDEYQLPSHRLVLEITESALLQATGTVGINLNTIREAGFQLAIDDFGTGFSSLSYLSDYPFTHLKIDKSFIASVTHNQRSAYLLEAIVDLSKAFEMTTIAEGVETQEQLDFLSNADCHYCQGYYFGKPLPIEQLIENNFRD